MKQQPITDRRLSEAEAMSLVNRIPAGQHRHARPQATDTQARLSVLTRTVEEQVIPRLVRARRATRAEGAGAPAPHIGPAHVETLLDLVLRGTQPQTDAYVCSMCDAGAGPEALMLDLFTQTARQLGEMWEDDTCDFTDVTLGVLRLANVMRLVGSAFEADLQPGPAAPRALLAQMPGEQHGFGLAMVVHFFRRAGWNVCNTPSITSEGLVDLVKQRWFGIVGLSVSCNDRLESLAADIRAIRNASCNRAIGVMVGGPPFIKHPQLAAMIGADATASDARQAVLQAQTLLSHPARNR